jgi:hypothetical protein
MNVIGRLSWFHLARCHPPDALRTLSLCPLGEWNLAAEMRLRMKETLKSILAGVDHVIRRVQFDVNPDPRSTTLIAGTGRSGTAWVANIVNYSNESRHMFEPFNPYKVPACARFRYRQYLRPDNTDPGFVEPALAIVSGRIKNDWIDQFNGRLVSRSRVIKEIRANLMLKWLKARFPGMKIVMMLRHPCADAASRLYLGWQSHLDELLAQDDLVADHLEPFVKDIRAANTDFERHVFLWCIENYVPLRQLAQGDVHLAFYEDLCERPRIELDRLFGYLGRSYDDRVFDAIKRPSALSREESAIVLGGNLIDSWRSYVNEREMRRALEIVRLFGLEAIYSEHSMPDVAAAERILGTPLHWVATS